MTLRQKAISALWRGFGVDLPNAEYGDMANALDEMLDCLAENADEWSDLEEKLHTGEPFGASWHNSHAEELRHLVAVLREDR